jgi:hypothetical protein
MIELGLFIIVLILANIASKLDDIYRLQLLEIERRGCDEG